MPTELIKTKMQLYPEWSKAGIRETIKDTIAKRGISGIVFELKYFKGLYVGLSTLLFFSIPKTGVRFSAKKFADESIFEGKKSRLRTVAGGVFAGIIEAICVVTPQETLKTKLMHDKFRKVSKYKNLFHGVMTILKKEGFKGVYMGCAPTLGR